MSEPVPKRFNIARYCLADNARLRPDRTAMVVVGDGLREERWSFAEVDLMVRRVAAGLKAMGLPGGSRLMIHMGNVADYPILYLAAIAAGLVPLPSSAQLTTSEAEFLLTDSGATVLALSSELGTSLPPLPGIHVLGPDTIAALKSTTSVADYADTAADDPAYLIYTSGTSGRPKGVLHAQRAAWGRRPMHDHWMNVGADDVMLHAGAFNWTYTLGVGLVDPWACGATCIFYNGKRDPTIWPRLIENYRATIFAAVPTVYRQMLKYTDMTRFDLSSLRHGLTAGEALSPALLQQWRDKVGTELYEALGMSEVSTYISSGPTVPTRLGSPGKPQPGRRVAILPIQGGSEPLPPDSLGLLAVHRSDPSLMLGYWRRPEEEAQVYRGEWFVGGDLATIDGDGYVWYHGRNDDVMNAMGYRVSPAEVEGALQSHPDIAEIAVAERHVRDDVSVIAAYVVPRRPGRTDATGILAFAAERLATYKRPREVIFVERLPRTANGKIMRRRLQDLAGNSKVS